MADGTVNNGGFSEDQTVEITGDESFSKISGLTQKISDLELENGEVIQENNKYKKQLEELKESVDELISENNKKKKLLEEAESENKSLGSDAARASDLEAEVAKLHSDLSMAKSDLQESTVELTSLRKELEEVKKRETENNVKLAAITNERDLLLDKFEKLKSVESILQDESNSKEKEILVLQKGLEEFNVVKESGKVLEVLKAEMEKTIENLKERISTLESALDEKEKIINDLDIKRREVEEIVINGDAALVNGEKKGAVGGLKQSDWVMIGGSTFAAVAVMGIICYVHVAKKH